MERSGPLVHSLCLLTFLGLAACTGGGLGGGGSSGDDDDSGGDGGGSDTGEQPPQGGDLTAADFDDNLNFDDYQAFLASVREQYPWPSFDADDRVAIRVTDADGMGIPNARVTVRAAGNPVFAAWTATDGRLYYFPGHDGGAQETLTVDITPPDGQGAPLTGALAPEGSEWTFALDGGEAQLPTQLDLAFVVDATGSMADELAYLNVEIQEIADAVGTAFPEVEVRYGLVVYRDHDDEYVVRSFDFGTLEAFRDAIAVQSADGGGDTPEALDEALAAAAQLGWRTTGNVARVAFLVADAPAHEDRIDAFFDQVDSQRGLGVRWYPLAASGATTDAESLLRVLGQSTGGRYLFLTDDSGIGSPHEEPHVPCYNVQSLQLLVGRMIATELTGSRVEADPADIIRTVGTYADGVCLDEQNP